MPKLTVLTGASRGLGLAMAHQLLTEGDTLLCISRNNNSALETGACQSGTKLTQWCMDLTDGLVVATALEAWLQTCDAIQWATATLINNACVIPPLAPLDASNVHDVSAALRVGLEAPLLLCSAFLRATEGWKLRRRILNISSGLGTRPMASSATYCAAKAGMDHFTRCLALEQARNSHGAKVCSLSPGVIDTEMQIQLRQADPLLFPDQSLFSGMHQNGQLTSPAQAASRVLAYLDRSDFGQVPVADVRI
jgi:NAD(P)-dependent dehydrogenase (short-subunit alcohol dehydrogenase family)